MIKHTPGPWYVLNGCDIFTDLGAKNAEDTSAPHNDGWHIADVDMGGLCLAELSANARLIAAAPELLDALEHSQRLFERLGLQSSDEYQANSYAIAKAKGECK